MIVSVLLLTFNESKNLPRCLEALRWCDDIIVVDSGSLDNSGEIAKMYGARVLQRDFDDFAAQRNFGIAEGKPKHDWVLHLDADEVVTDDFVRELKNLDPPPDVDAYHVPSKLMLFNKWLRHAGMYPTYQVRIGRLEKLRFIQVGHGQREDLPPEKIGIFSEPYLHFSVSHGLAAWFRKHAKYAEYEAQYILDRNKFSQQAMGVDVVARRRWLKSKMGLMPLILRPFGRAFYMLIIKRAILDGQLGLLYVGMLCIYEAMISIQVMYYKSAVRNGVGDQAQS